MRLSTATALIFSGCVCSGQVSRTVPPVTAIYEVRHERTLADGKKLERVEAHPWYRDSNGRTRLEQDHLVTISDPVDRTIYILDPAEKTAQRVAMPTRAAESRVGQQNPPAAPADVSINERGSLGSQFIEGYESTGKETVLITPPNSRLGNKDPIEHTLQMWTSSELKLPLLTIVNDPLTGKRTQRYTNIRTGAEPSMTLFQVPVDFQVIDAPRGKR